MLINNEIIDKKHYMQCMVIQCYLISLIPTICLSYAKYFLYGYNLGYKIQDNIQV